MARFTFNLGGHLFERVTLNELHKVFSEYEEVQHDKESSLGA